MDPIMQIAWWCAALWLASRILAFVALLGVLILICWEL